MPHWQESTIPTLGATSPRTALAPAEKPNSRLLPKSRRLVLFGAQTPTWMNRECNEINGLAFGSVLKKLTSGAHKPISGAQKLTSVFVHLTKKYEKSRPNGRLLRGKTEEVRACDAFFSVSALRLPDGRKPLMNQ
jgi:hypothetical protein